MRLTFDWRSVNGEGPTGAHEFEASRARDESFFRVREFIELSERKGMGAKVWKWVTGAQDLIG